MTTRRTFLVGAGLVAAGGLYSIQRGIRYPRLGLEPAELDSYLSTEVAQLDLSDLIALEQQVEHPKPGLHLRAIAPEPKLEVSPHQNKLRITINNIAPNARLTVDGKGIREVDEQTSGLSREINISLSDQQKLTLHWKLPDRDQVKFAVIGDTGGNRELDWCLQRAANLGAQFLLHLGDFNYGNSDYQRAITQFHNAPIPCYVSIGNHDFNDSGLVYQRFLNELGPMNHSFTIAGTRFSNIDTAADFFPASSGNRGRLFDELQRAHLQKTAAYQQVFFTHRPLRDPRPHDDHEVGGHNEVAWLTQSILAMGGGTFLNGHVHHSAELDVEGIHQYTVGEGLGHEDLVLQRQTSKLLIGIATSGSEVNFTWVPLDMPWQYHQSHTHASKLKHDKRTKQLKWYQDLLSSNSSA